MEETILVIFSTSSSSSPEDFAQHPRAAQPGQRGAAQPSNGRGGQLLAPGQQALDEIFPQALA